MVHPPRFAAAIFDLDGTLIDSLADIAAAANDVLVDHGFRPRDLDEYRRFVGEGVARLFAQALPIEACSEELIASCVAGFKFRYDQYWDRATRPYDGIPELLDALQAQHCRLAVLSNKPHEFTARCVERMLPEHHFAAVLGQRDGYPRKPDPAGALEIVRQLELTPEQSLYIGDSEVDMATAVRAGMYPVGVLWGFRSAEQLRAAGARTLLERPAQLLDLINGRRTGSI